MATKGRSSSFILSMRSGLGQIIASNLSSISRASGVIGKPYIVSDCGVGIQSKSSRQFHLNPTSKSFNVYCDCPVDAGI
jgi:hypothetical protein